MATELQASAPTAKLFLTKVHRWYTVHPQQLNLNEDKVPFVYEPPSGNKFVHCVDSESFSLLLKEGMKKYDKLPYRLEFIKKILFDRNYF